MYLLAAPFLAIAVYYLLQVVATNTATPVLVLMAFSTGLISDSIVTRITTFANETIGRSRPPETEGDRGHVTVTSVVEGGVEQSQQKTKSHGSAARTPDALNPAAASAPAPPSNGGSTSQLPTPLLPAKGVPSSSTDPVGQTAEGNKGEEPDRPSDGAGL
jgi:hypothetical protein